MRTGRLAAIERNVLAGFIGTAIVLLVLGAGVHRVVTTAVSATERVTRTHEALSALEAFEAALFRAESAQRGFYLSGSDELVDERDRAIAAANAALRALRAYSLGTAPEQGWLRDLEVDLRDRIAAFLERERTFRTLGFEAIRSQWPTHQGPRLTRELSDSLAALEEAQLAALNAARGQQTAELASVKLGAAAVLALLLMFEAWLFWRIRTETTARQATEAELQRSEARLREILEVLPVGVALRNAPGAPREDNATGKAILRDWEGDAGGTITQAWWARDGRPLTDDDEPLALALRGAATPPEEIELQCADGSRKILLVAAAPLRAAGGAVAVFQDITPLKRAELSLRETARFDATHREALTLFNAESGRDALLSRLLRLLAEAHPFPVSAFYAPESASGGRLVLAAALGATDAIRREFAFGEGLVGEVARSNTPMAVPFPDRIAGLEVDAGVAGFRPAEVLLHPVSYRDCHHGVLVLGAGSRPSSGERAFVERLCAQLGVALHNLEQLAEVRSLAAELRESLDDIVRKNALLEDASRMKSEFLANMSHELRTPLNAIIGFSEVLRDGLVGPLGDKQKEYVSDIFDSGQHLLALINDILDLSKIEAGKLELDVEPLELQPLLASSLGVLREKAASRRVTLVLDADPGLGTIHGDARKVRQIVYNLVSNAIKFSDEGGRVEVSAKPVSRERAAGATPGHGHGVRMPLPENDHSRFVEISVGDGGIGLAPGDMARLFQPFVQIESSLSRQYEGTGLGLAMVRRLAELHGGTVAVSSTPGEGSCFTVWLPYGSATGPRVERGRSRAATAVPASTGKSALIIEDDGHATELMRGLLVREGYEVRVARSAEEGLEMAASSPSVIVLDILLPGMDGWDCLARLKQTPALAHIPVVIVSMVADRERGRALGAAAVLQKPLRRAELLAAVSRLGAGESRAPARVLLVDDDPKAIELATAILAEAGWRVLQARGGAEGIERALSELPDLIVLDIMMPGIDGFDVVAALRLDERAARIPILVLTSKDLDAGERERLGQVHAIVGKGGFGREAFLNEVRRAVAMSPAAIRSLEESA